MSSNPLYLFFSTPPSFGPLFLRLALAVILFYQGSQKAFGWFGGEGWNSTIAAWTDPSGINLSYVIIATVIVGELAASVSLLFGILTRLAALLVVLIMGGALFYMYGGKGIDAIQFPVLLLASGMALLFMGGGHLSIDRAIGRNLLPYIG